MQLNEINKKVSELGNAWHEFKQTNDERLKSLETKTFDPLTEQKLTRINNVIDECQNRISSMEVANARLIEGNFNDQNDIEHKQAFCEYLTKGNDNLLTQIEKKSLSTISGQEGGYLVRENLADKMMQQITAISPLRKLANVQTISTDSLDIIEDLEQMTAGWTNETDERNDESNININKKKILVHEMYAQPKATQKLIDDAAIDIEKWLSDKLVDAFANTEKQAFIHGDGKSKPSGILSDKANLETIAAKQITADEIINLYYRLNENYAANASFLMNRATLAEIRKLKTQDGHYLWSPSYSDKHFDTILGARVEIYSAMDNIAINKTPIILGDFKAGYTIIDRQGINIMRDPYTQKPFVKFYATKRIGASVTNKSAIKLLEIGKS